MTFFMLVHHRLTRQGRLVANHRKFEIARQKLNLRLGRKLLLLLDSFCPLHQPSLPLVILQAQKVTERGIVMKLKFKREAGCCLLFVLTVQVCVLLRRALIHPWPGICTTCLVFNQLMRAIIPITKIQLSRHHFSFRRDHH